MPSARTRKRIYLAIVITIAMGFLLPPSVNLNHFRPGLSQSLSRALGRPVSIQDVRLRLLPLPGFTFRHLRIADEDEFGAEPILQTSEDDGQHSVATLRVSSLWRGRLEIASISLTQASFNLVRTADGHWNLERLINRAAQVPSAPTAKKKAEARARFPYIELTESRINFKFGPEKKPFALSEAQFALWLAAENRWNVRLKAVPLRSDESLSDAGVIKVYGSFDRAPEFSDTPFHFQVSWARPEVDAITRIVRGRDPGWRGAVELNAELKGTPRDFVARTSTAIDEFRRYDIARSNPLDVRFSCNHHFRTDVPETNSQNQLEFNCKVPLDSGTLVAEGELHPLGRSPDFSVRLFASDVPVSAFVRAMLHAKSTLPDDLTGQGMINGDWYIERVSGFPIVWKGAFTAMNASLHSTVLHQPLLFPSALEVQFEPPQAATKARNARLAPQQQALSRAVIAPFTVDLGGDTEISGSFDPDGYRLNLNGSASWQRLIQVARAIGVHPPQTDVKGSGVVAVQYSGEWQHFAPSAISGEAQIRSAVLSLQGFSEPLRVSSGILKIDGPGFQAEQIEGRFPHSGFAFRGSFSGTRQCEHHLLCDVTFALRTDELRETTLAALLSKRSGISLPFFASADRFDAKWLLELPITGTVTAQHLAIGKFQARNVTAQLESSDGKLLVHHCDADLFGGKHDGEWAFDFSGPRPAITGTGSIQRGQMGEVSTALDDQIGTGNFDLQYRLTMNGRDLEQLATSAEGSGAFSWKNGLIETIPSDSTHLTALSFNNWSGHFTIEKRRISLDGTKMVSTSGVREVSGEVSFAREWNLRFLRANGSSFVATGNITNPVISYEPAKLAEAR